MAFQIPGQIQAFHIPGEAPILVPVEYYVLAGYGYQWETKPLNQLPGRTIDPHRSPTDQPKDSFRIIPGTGHARVLVAWSVFEPYRTRAAAVERTQLAAEPYRMSLTGPEAEELVAAAESPGGNWKREWYVALHRKIYAVRAAFDGKLCAQPHPLDGAVAI